MHIPKERLLSRSGTCMQSCCTGGGMRGCLRVYDGIPAGAAECRRDLAVDSRGEVPTKIRV